MQSQLDSTIHSGISSDSALEHLRPGLEALGYEVESGKGRSQKVRRPVLFGDNGAERVAYEVDAFHDDLGIVLEVEAGRGAKGNATYRDLIRTSLIVGADYLVLGVMNSYRFKSGGKELTVTSYKDTRDQIDAIYSSRRLGLPFKGILLFGY